MKQNNLLEHEIDDYLVIYKVMIYRKITKIFDDIL